MCKYKTLGYTGLFSLHIEPPSYCWKEKNSKQFTLYDFTAEQVRSELRQKLENVVKIFRIVISNDPGSKVFPLNQVIDEVKCQVIDEVKCCRTLVKSA